MVSFVQWWFEWVKECVRSWYPLCSDSVTECVRSLYPLCNDIVTKWMRVRWTVGRWVYMSVYGINDMDESDSWVDESESWVECLMFTFRAGLWFLWNCSGFYIVTAINKIHAGVFPVLLSLGDTRKHKHTHTYTHKHLLIHTHTHTY